MKKVKIALLACAAKCFRHCLWALAIQVMLNAAMSLGAVAQTPPPGNSPKPAPQAVAKSAEASKDEPTVSLSPARLDFGDCETGKDTDAKAVTLTNDGKMTIIVDKVKIKGDFIGSNSCSEPLEPGKSCIISIKFSPKETDKRDGALLVTFKAQEDGNSIISSKPVELRGRGLGSLLATLWPALAIVGIYLVGLIFVRWNMVALPAIRHLHSHIDAAKQRIDALKSTSGAELPGVAHIKKLLDNAESLISYRRKIKFLDWLFWTRGQEGAGWNYLHEALEQSAYFLSDEQVRASLETAESNLRQAGTPSAIGLAGRIHEALTTIPAAAGAVAVMPIDRWRALLAEARNFLYGCSDRNFDTMMSWQNKTMWLIICSLLLIVCLTAVINNGVLFLVGATGGLLSRLQRSLYRQDVPTDYGASWTTLFLSPLVGALAGWSGILLLTLLIDFNILGTAVKVDWYSPYAPVTLGLALLLGISERLLNGFVTSLEDKLKAQPGATKTAEAAALKIDTEQLPESKVGESYPETTLIASGGTKPYTWYLIGGTKLPERLALDKSSGKISGTPTVAGPFRVTLQVTDKDSKTSSKEYTIQVKS